MQKGLFWLCICMLFVYCNKPEEHSLKDLCPDTSWGKNYYAFSCEVTDLRKGKDFYNVPDQEITASFSNKPEVIGGLNCRKFVFDTEHPEMFVHFCCTDKHVLIRHKTGEYVAIDTIMGWHNDKNVWEVLTTARGPQYRRFTVVKDPYLRYMGDSLYVIKGDLGSFKNITTWSRYEFGFFPNYGIVYFVYSFDAMHNLRCECNTETMKSFWAQYE